MSQCVFPAKPLGYWGSEEDEELRLEKVYVDGNCPCGAVQMLIDNGDLIRTDELEAEEPEPEWLQWCRAWLARRAFERADAWA
jgi:hypothetical protein